MGVSADKMSGRVFSCSVWVTVQCPCILISVFLCLDPPDATVSTPTGDWFVGLEKAELVCATGGYPKPQNITWTRYHHQLVCCTYISAI